MRSLLVIFTLTLLSNGLISQSDQSKVGYSIEVELENYSSDTLLLAYYFWDKQFLKDTAFRKDNVFLFKDDEPLPAGIYLLVPQPQSDIVQLVIGEEDQHFKVRAHADSLSASTEVIGSNENTIFYDYLDFLGRARDRSGQLQKKYGENPDSLKMTLRKLDDEVKEYQDRLLENNPESMAAFIIQASQEVEIPEFTGPMEEIRDHQYRYYVNHFFDPYDFRDDRWIYTAFLHEKINKYLKKVIVQIPDTINKSLDLILSKFNEDSEGYKRVLVHYLNDYASSDFVGMDAVYVHLVNKYYAQGKAPWVSKEQLAKMKDDAQKLEPILIGKSAPEITVFKRDQTPVPIQEVDAKYTILLFWAPDCGHCKKKMPKLVQLYPEWKQKGAELITICTKLVDKEPKCWEYLDEFGLDGPWLTTSDKFLRSRFKQKYNITSTPQLFILDQDKKIVSKKIGVDQVSEVLDTLREIEEQESKS